MAKGSRYLRNVGFDVYRLWLQVGVGFLCVCYASYLFAIIPNVYPVMPISAIASPMFCLLVGMYSIGGPFIWLDRTARLVMRVEALEGRVCIGCGYNLSGLIDEGESPIVQCPECGESHGKDYIVRSWTRVRRSARLRNRVRRAIRLKAWRVPPG